MGGADDLDNLIELSIEEHAEAHKVLFEKHGKWEDELAWKALSGQVTMSEASKIAQKNGQILGGKIQGKRSAENGHLKRICTKEVQVMGGLAQPKEAKALGGRNGSIESKRAAASKAGKKCFEEKTGVFAPEHLGKGGRIGGKIGGKKAIKILQAMRYECEECGYTSTPRWTKHHINKTGHSGYIKL